MGHEWVDLTVRAKLSRHNSAQDDFDDARWADLQRVIEELCAEFNDIDAEAYS